MSAGDSDESSTRRKVEAILGELSVPSSTLFEFPPPVAKVIETVLNEELELDDSHELAFHLTDWGDDLAFLLSLYLRPDRLSSQEIVEGLGKFLAHVPNHLAAAAFLWGLPVEDVFEIGAITTAGEAE